METRPDAPQSDGTSRRFFLGAAASLTGAALAAAAASRTETGEAAVIPAAAQGFVTAGFNLLIDGSQAGSLVSATGGSATSDVVLEKLGPDHIVHKHLAGVKYEDITIQPTFPVSPQLAAQIDSMMNLKLDPFGGAVQEFSFGLKVMVERDFTNALVTEIGFPACDAGSKDPAYLTVGFSPETTTRVTNPKSTVPAPRGRPRVFLPSNFRLAIDNLNTTGVRAIDAFTLKLDIDQSTVGETRDVTGVAFLDVPNLKITLSESSAQTWFDWFKSFVIDGNNGDDQERNGSLTLLTPDLKLALATISFSHLGIFKLTPESVQQGSTNIRRVKAELYCEDMQFTFGPGAWA